MKIILNLCAAVVLASASMSAPALAQDLPSAAAHNPLFGPLLPLVGKTWRGKAVGQENVEDIMRWEWAVGGHALRARHAVNGGAYGGETLVFPDKDSQTLIFHYFTSGGFHTTGTIKPQPDNSLLIEETVHGAEGIETLRTVARFDAEGYHPRSTRQENGQWVEFGGFDYAEDPAAHVAEPVGPQASASLTLSRPIIADPTEPGQDVAGYVRVANASVAADRLIAASCSCAERIEFHVIRRAEGQVRMDADPFLEVPAGGTLDIRPGSDLHLMLIGWDPSRTADGKARLRLNFANAGEQTVDFSLAQDSRAAWAAFD